ncbi:hypothetical protein MKW98_017640 [Papaver atlanticum]|uniref:Formin-like protein n=1 Tax=Papaver atlanticum TaxID=357466 RepID=A0AAD4TEU5_9MAGN|nr:hypothetical protein MKW98_017640 [Papaver atlanticum]
MGLFRRLFYQQPPDRLLEIAERVYVFDCCFSTDVMEENDYKRYMDGIASQLLGHFPGGSFMVFNFKEGEMRSQISDILSEYDMTVMDYPRQYEGCPLLPLETIHHFLRSSESWLSLGQQNVLLMHCERGGWPVLAFMLAALLLYRKQYTVEQKTLEMVYKQAPKELLHLVSPLNPQPSQLRYLQYISRRNLDSDWPSSDTPLTLNSLILRVFPVINGKRSCRPIVRVYGQDPSTAASRSSKLLFSAPKQKKRHSRQAESTMVKVDINCCVQGDVVLECIHLDEDMAREEMIFRLMFNTSFIQSNALLLTREDIDLLWDAEELFLKDFKVEVRFLDPDIHGSTSAVEVASGDEDDTEGGVEEFFEVEEIFNSADGPGGASDSDNVNNVKHQKAVFDLHNVPDNKLDGENCQQNVKEDFGWEIVKLKHTKPGDGNSTDNPRVQHGFTNDGDIKLETETPDTCRQLEANAVTDVQYQSEIKQGAGYITTQSNEWETPQENSDMSLLAQKFEKLLPPTPREQPTPNEKPAPDHVDVKQEEYRDSLSEGSEAQQKKLEMGLITQKFEKLLPSAPGEQPAPNVKTSLEPVAVKQEYQDSIHASAHPPSGCNITAYSPNSVPADRVRPALSPNYSAPLHPSPSVPGPPPTEAVAPRGPPPPPPRRPGPPGPGPPGLLRVRPKVPRIELRPFHWIKFGRVLPGSLWAEAQRSEEPQSASTFDVSEVESLFSKPLDTNKQEDKSGAGISSPRPKRVKVHLIDLKKSNNTEIMLTKVKMPFSDMMTAALAMDESVLDDDQVENLIKFCPTKEEMEQLENYNGDKDVLGKCEQFFLELMKVPRMETKLRVFSFKIQFIAQILDLRKSLGTVNSACEEVRDSLKLKEIMKQVLHLGNAINQGTSRGLALGFKLDSLLKLGETRAYTSKMSLMHYLCKVLAAKSPRLLDFHSGLASLEAASKIQLKSLAEEMQAITDGLDKVNQELIACANDGPVSEVFQKTLTGFTEFAEAEVASLISFYSVAGKNADALVVYFGEEPAKYPFEQVTTTLLSFVQMFRKAHEENLKEAQVERKKAERENSMERAKGIDPTKKITR